MRYLGKTKERVNTSGNEKPGEGINSSSSNKNVNHKKDANPISNALFYHFQKYNPEFLSEA